MQMQQGRAGPAANPPPLLALAPYGHAVPAAVHSGADRCVMGERLIWRRRRRTTHPAHLIGLAERRGVLGTPIRRLWEVYFEAELWLCYGGCSAIRRQALWAGERGTHGGAAPNGEVGERGATV